MATGKQASIDDPFVLLVLVPWHGNQDAITIAIGKKPGCPFLILVLELEAATSMRRGQR
jgi:hypothetical protein